MSGDEKAVRVREAVSGRAPARYLITEISTGREVIRTEDAAALRGFTTATMRKDITRRRAAGLITDLAPLDARTPLYYPEDLGLETPK